MRGERRKGEGKGRRRGERRKGEGKGGRERGKEEGRGERRKGEGKGGRERGKKFISLRLLEKESKIYSEQNYDFSINLILFL